MKLRMTNVGGLRLLTLTLLLSLVLMTAATSVQAQENSVEFSLDVTNLGDPGNDHYEGWLITDSEAVPAGKFTLDSDKNIVDLDGNAIATFDISGVSIDDVEKYVITLEPEGDTDTVPAAIKPVAGDFNSAKTSASLSINIDADFSSVSGDYILATPTDNNTDVNENAGIWYLSLETGSPAVGFDLPDLTGTDWTYEGWVVIDGVPLTTGTFDEFDVADNSAPYSNTTVSGPPFPGEDYLINAPQGMSFPADLAGQHTAITIEPRMDNSDAPFQFHVLEDDIPGTATDHVTYNMDDITDTFPSGTVTVVGDDDSSSEETPLAGIMVTVLSGMVLMASVRMPRQLRKNSD